MKFYKSIAMGIAIILLAGNNTTATEKDINTFSFIKPSSTNGLVAWGESTLIKDDNLSYFPDILLSTKVDKQKTETVDDWQLFNCWSTNRNIPFRREISISGNGREIELNFKANQPAYHQIESNSLFKYEFRVPFDILNETEFTAITGRANKPKIVTGMITDNTSGRIIKGTRYATFKKDKKTIIFDFGPEGSTSFSDYGPNTIQNMWSIRREGKYFLFSFGCRNTDFGGMISSKVKIYTDTKSIYLERHANDKYSYFDALPLEKAFCFGATIHGDSYTNIGISKYSATLGAGWLSEANIKVESLRKSGVLYSAVTSKYKNSFRCNLKRPGLYIFTLRCTGYGEKTGSFSIQSNERRIADNIDIPAFSVKTITWSQWIENGTSDITFTGDNWAVSALGIQMLQHSMEDFKFRRGFWRANGLFEPHPINANSCFEQPAQYTVDISETTLPQNIIEDPEGSPVVPQGGICLPSSDAPQMDWRYNAVIGSLGPSNHGSFTEFNNANLIKRRLKEIKDSGVNAVLLNGLLSRHTFPSQLKRVEKTITEIVAEAHRQGMKIIDHQDVTLLWNLGQGSRVMCKKIKNTQRSIDGNFPLRGFCINNPKFNASFYKWLIDYIQKTDIDGIMLDEVVFFGDNFCGCQHCRKLFTENTGLILPLDETSPLLFNKKSKLWKAWLQWRIKSVGDWNLNLRCHILPIKPNFTIMKYTTHYGFSSHWAPLSHGASLIEAARSCNFLGTEIMSRNVMASHRAVFAFRKAKNALRTALGTPIFGLVYPMQSDDFAYFGWAMNNMNAQVTWMMQGRIKNDHSDNKFTDFKDNFNLKNINPASEIALLFPLQSRNWGKYVATIPDVMGVSQMLTDKHIMHDMIVEQSLTPGFLMKYRAVIINSANALSNEQIDNLLQYVNNGGTLYISSTTGTCDQMGNTRKTWPFEKALGINFNVDNKFKMIPLSAIMFKNETPMNYSRLAIRFSIAKNNSPEIIAEAINKNGKVSQPLIVENKYGKGRIIYCAIQLGSINHEAEKTIGKKWIFTMDENAKDFFIKTVRNVILKNENLAFEAVEIPKDVLVSVYTERTAGNNITIINLLNAIAASDMQLDQVISAQAPNPAWAPITKDIVFDIALPSPPKITAVSPDWEGKREIKSTSGKNGIYRVIVPKESLKCYTVIRIET